MIRGVKQFTVTHAVKMDDTPSGHPIKIEIKVTYPATARWWHIVPVLYDAYEESRSRLTQLLHKEQ